MDILDIIKEYVDKCIAEKKINALWAYGDFREIQPKKWLSLVLPELVNTGCTTVKELERYKEELREYDVFFDIDTDKGLVFVIHNDVALYNEATAYAVHKATIRAYDKTSVVAFNDVIVYAFDHANIRLYDTSRCVATDNVVVIAYNDSIVRHTGCGRVSAYCNSNIEAYPNVFVSATNNAFVMSNGATVVCDEQVTVKAYTYNFRGRPSKNISHVTAFGRCVVFDKSGDAEIKLSNDAKIWD